jgi:hypothetical protein
MIWRAKGSAWSSHVSVGTFGPTWTDITSQRRSAKREAFCAAAIEPATLAATTAFSGVPIEDSGVPIEDSGVPIEDSGVPIEDQEIVIAREHARRDRAAHPAEADEVATFSPPSRLSLPPAPASGTIAVASPEWQGRPSAHRAPRRRSSSVGKLIVKRVRVNALDDGREHGVELVLRFLGVEVHLCEAVDTNLGRLR